MTDILSTLLFQHDLRLVALAALICALSATAGISLLVHARRTRGGLRLAWLSVAAVSVGFGIWATHFVAMLSFDAGFPAGYDMGLTLISLAIAIGVCGGGLWFAAHGERHSDLFLGGAIVGIGISAMHFTGMAALRIGGTIAWDIQLVATSLILGITFGGLSLLYGARARSWAARAGAIALLTAAVCTMHFTAMGAAGFENCFAIVGPDAVSPSILSLGVGLASILILAFALGGVFLDMRDRKQAAREARRMRGLANAAVEGLIVCDRETIVAVNASFVALVDVPESTIAGRAVSDFFPAAARADLARQSDLLMETELTPRTGPAIPVEVARREVEYGGGARYALAVRDLRARKDAERHIRFLAHHDAMTGLANRASFNNRLEEEITTADRQRQRFAVLCLDLDRFKEVNDLFGHATGDAVLQKVGAVLEGVGSASQFAARLGGDEFAVILPEITTPDQAGRMAQAIIDAFVRENDEAQDGTMMSASIGIAIYPDDARDAQTLMTFADTALYCAKDEGRGIYRFFEPQMGAKVRDRRQLEHDLRQALARNELSLVYQPQADLKSGEITGFEALVRWTHPVRGAVSPADFVPVAEEAGLILAIGEWVLKTACSQAASWTAPLTIAVNVSPLQLHAQTFAPFVAKTLAQTGLPADRLEIEITETALIRNMNRALASLRKVKALGVRIAMDDFGTGYSSLSNLRAFPFDKIKVDQSFIRSVHSNEQSATIVRAVLGLGRGLKLPVLAEGVEHADELAFLKDEICDGAQGFWIGRPQSIEAYRDITSPHPEPLPRAQASA